MKGDNDHPSIGPQQLVAFCQKMLQTLQLPINSDSQGLKSLRGRMMTFASFPLGPDNDFRQIRRGLDGLVSPSRGNRASYATRLAFLTIISENPLDVSLGEPVHNVESIQGLAMIHAHVESSN